MRPTRLALVRSVGHGNSVGAGYEFHGIGRSKRYTVHGSSSWEGSVAIGVPNSKERTLGWELCLLTASVFPSLGLISLPGREVVPRVGCGEDELTSNRGKFW